MKRCVIVGGAPIGDYARARALLRPDDFVICCDSGLYHADALGVPPGLIVGDFDSHPRPQTDTETVVLPREKDDTDTFFAAREAVRRGFDDFLLLGAVGARLDHSLGNVSVLLWLDANGRRGTIADDYSLMTLVPPEGAEIDGAFAYFSLLCVGGAAEGVTVENAKFPLRNARIAPEYQYGVSNEVLPGKTARVTVEKGTLLLVKVF